ncbi:MAG: hypothetical protein Q8Q59_11140 [Luteolibacter sp.]|jgi:RecA-family ATPase|nr:hypothetical protein [Luteolibacter sp.]
MCEAAGDLTAKDGMRETLAERAFNFALAPLPPYPILRLGDRTISTPGNLTGIQGPVKSGKTGVLEAMIAAAFNANRQGPDTLGFSAENIHGKAMIHIDTEQSRYDHDSLIRRAMRRARVATPPPWFYSYSLTDMTVAQRRDALEIVIEDTSARHGGVFLIIIDGVADLCASPNDEVEAYALVGRLHALAIHQDCAIVCVLHENPGSDNGKMRGHLGSQLERKAETPLRLAKDAASGVTTIWSDRARHCHLPREQGICFAWSDEARMHVSVGTVREIKASAKSAKFRAEAEAAFSDSDSMTYSELVARVAETAFIAPKTAERRVKTYTAEGIIRKTEAGNYGLKS